MVLLVGGADRGRQAAMFSREGSEVLEQLGARLFPATIRPAFFRVLWAALALLGVAAVVVGMAVAGRLP